MLSIGERLRIARKAASLSLRDAAKEIGISAQAISKYERNLTKPNSKRLIQFARAYGVRVEFFLRAAPPIKLELVHICRAAYAALKGDIDEQ